jgi:UDP-2,3-diacylglucosamine pyrophosphatase LpxH
MILLGCYIDKKKGVENVEDGKKMTRIFFSDVHIGHPDNHNYDMFLKFFKEECFNYDEIIMVGDIFEFWLNKRNTVMEIAKPFIEMVNSPEFKCRVIYIPGNHDYRHHYKRKKILDVKTFYPNFVFHVKGKLFVVTHGHNQAIEAKLITAPLFKYIMDKQIFVSFFYKMFALPQYYPIEWLYKWLTQSRKDAIQGELESGAKKLGENVIMGHSHIPIVKENYFNCGNWMEQTDYLVMNDEGKVELKSYAANITKVD